MQTPSVLAALPPWAAALVWAAAIIGAAVFVYRRVTGAGRDEKSPVDDLDSDSPRAFASPLPPPAPDPAAEPTAAPPSAFFVEPTPDRPGIPLTGEPGSDVPPAVAGVGSAEPPATTASSGPLSSRAGYFAPGAAAAASGEAEATRRLTVAEALRGIAMPCGLSPVIDGSVSIPNPFRVAFLTTSSDAATVGSSLGDELERLGYALTTSTATEVLARKPGIELRVVLYPTPATASRGLEQLFPVAPPGSVGVEFST